MDHKIWTIWDGSYRFVSAEPSPWVVKPVTSVWVASSVSLKLVTDSSIVDIEPELTAISSVWLALSVSNVLIFEFCWNQNHSKKSRNWVKYFRFPYQMVNILWPYLMDQTIWSISYGPSHMDHIIWTISYGPYHMDHIIWNISYLWYGTCYMSDIRWVIYRINHKYGPYYMVHMIWSIWYGPYDMVHNMDSISQTDFLRM